MLGAHMLESRDTRHTCFLIDSAMAVDAGSLASALTASEQAQVGVLLLTHGHFDHIRDLPTLGLATLDIPKAIDVYGLPETLDAIHEHLLNWSIYPDLTGEMNGQPAKYKFKGVAANEPFRLPGYQVKPIPMDHPVPCVGFIVKSDSGACAAFSGDTQGALMGFFQDSLSPEVLFVDVTFPNRMLPMAQLTGHQTPWMLREQLVKALAANLEPPRIIAVHLAPDHREQVAVELAELAAELGVNLAAADEGMVVAL